MPGMMRGRKSGCLCPDCGGPRIADRASEARDWRRTEWAQSDPRGYWDGAACEPAYYLAGDAESVDFGGWWAALLDGELTEVGAVRGGHHQGP